MDNALIPVAQLARDIADTIGQAMADIGKAASMYAQGLDDHGPALTERLVEIAPSVPRLFWRRLEQIGREQLDTRPLHGDTPSAARLRKLPYSQQKAALDTGVELLVGEGDTLLVQVDAMTPFQARQAFDGDHAADTRPHLNPDHAPYCDDAGWLLPREQRPAAEQPLEETCEGYRPDPRPGADQAQGATP